MLSYGPPLNKNKKWCMVLERVWESSTQLQIKKSSTANFFSQTQPTPAAPPWICFRKKGGADPKLHGFQGVPQEVLHQIQIS
jgi:hypothetical protein